jgi:sugar-phosphatase
MLVILECDAVLFDLDGTLIDSLPAVNRAWTDWAVRNGLDPEEIVPRIHGRRSIDSVRLLASHLDAEVEDAWLRNREATDTEGVKPLPGAVDFVAALPPDAWTIVTSGTIEVATPRILAAGLSVPSTAVFGNDVAYGKPAPDCFLLAAERLNLPANRCVVFEDTRAGLRSGAAAGCRTVGVRILPGEDLTSDSEIVISGYHEIRVAPAKGAHPVVLFVRE